MTRSGREKLQQLVRRIGNTQEALAEAQRQLDLLHEEAAYVFGDDWPLCEQWEGSPKLSTEAEREGSGLRDEDAGR